MVPLAGKDKFTAGAVWTLVGAFCVHFVIGSQYAWGTMAIYFVGYFRTETNNLDANMSQFYMVLPLIVIVSTFVFPVGMATAKKFGSRPVVLLGGLILVLSVIISSFMTSTSAFFVFYAIGFGIGKGFLYPAPLVAGWSHLECRRGLVSGVIVSGLGVGSFTFGLLFSLLVNPENEAPVM
jgi:MFS family permease